MKTLQDFKDDYAKENGYANWKDYEIEFSDFDAGSHFIGAMEIIAERYAEYMAIEFAKHCDIKYLEGIAEFKQEFDIFRQNKQ